jgi:hypothetical protein
MMSVKAIQKSQNEYVCPKCGEKVQHVIPNGRLVKTKDRSYRVDDVKRDIFCRGCGEKIDF